MLLLLVLLHEEYKSPDMLDHAKTKTTHVASVIVTKHILLKKSFLPVNDDQGICISITASLNSLFSLVKQLCTRS